MAEFQLCVCVCVCVCVCMYHLIYPVVYWWALRLLPCLSYCKQWCYEHWDAWLFSNICFHFFSGYISKSGISESYGISIFSFLRKFHTVSVGAARWYIPTNSIHGFPFSTSSPTFVICRLLVDGFSDKCEAISLLF